MNPFEEAKIKYESIPVSDQLADMVNQTIAGSNPIKVTRESTYSADREITMRQRSGRASRWGFVAAAALIACFVVTVNVNTAFAKDLANVPIIGTLVRLITIESYTTQDEDMGITVEVPQLEEIGKENTQLTNQMNKEISNLCNQYAEEAKVRALDYREAFLDTGGTTEEWTEHDIQIKVGYVILSDSEASLSFKVFGTESWSSAYAETRFYSLDKDNMQIITLKSLLGENYVTYVNESIKQQIAERNGINGESFFSDAEGGFTSIQEDQKFYVNPQGNPVIVFDKYAVAPGFMGEVEFEITKK